MKSLYMDVMDISTKIRKIICNIYFWLEIIIKKKSKQTKLKTKTDK